MEPVISVHTDGGERLAALEEKVLDMESLLDVKDQEIEDLAQIAAVITSVLDLESVLAITMETSLRHTAGEVGAVLLAEGSELKVKIAWGVDGDGLERLKHTDGRSLVRHCFETRETLVDGHDRHVESAAYSIHSLIAAPILAQSRALGVIVIINKENDGEFDARDRRTLEMIGNFAAVAIENSRLLRESMEKQKMEQELELARQVQTTLLPESFGVRGLQVASTYIPAGHVGGDYYDIIPLTDRRVLFLLGDVTNKGVPAALVMTAAYSIIHGYVGSREVVDIQSLMSNLNEVLCRHIIKSRDMFITLFAAFVDLDGGTMEYCNGGHPPAFFRRARTGEVLRLREGGPPLGQFAGQTYRSAMVPLAGGDRVFCYSDGLIEAEDGRGELYGLARLEEFFSSGAKMAADGFNQAVKQEVARFAAGSPRESRDDFTTLVFDIQAVVPGGERYQFVYPSRLDVMETMYLDLERVFTRCRIGPQTARPFQLALSEAFTNAIIHAHGQNPGKLVEVSIVVNDDVISADITDEGSCWENEGSRVFDPAGDPAAESGRGLGLIQRLTDSVHFSRSPRGGTTVTITKKIGRSDTGFQED